MAKNPEIETSLFLGEIGNVNEIDLHGEAPDNAVYAVDIFLNQEFMLGHEAARIIHGRGQGKLREAIHKLLKSHSLVSGFRDSTATTQVGGVTVVALHRR